MKKLFIGLVIGMFGLMNSMHGISISIGGKVSFGETNEGLPSNEVEVQIFYGQVTRAATTQTDRNGQYRIDFEIPSVSNIMDSLEIAIRTFDFCTGTYQEERRAAAMERDVKIEVNFRICRTFDPPTVTVACNAIYYFDQLSFEAPYEVQFLDLSYSNLPIHSWLWDFGDGQSSEEPVPMHQYQEAGTYQVSLTITSDSCSSTYTSNIVISHGERCDCPDVFEPVCITDPITGIIQTFINACWAKCGGIDEANFERCNGCNCPVTIDPVCVSTADSIMRFDNVCLARCEGFLAEEIERCRPIEDCLCEDIYQPVCIFLPNGEFKEFPNACFAACEGYFTLFSCEGNQPDSCTAAFFVDSPDPAELLVIFNDISTSNTGPVVGWKWDFGDGNGSSEPSPSHVYDAEGSYLVTLSIETADGCSASIEQPINIGRNSDCLCTTEYDPVCVLLNSGYKITFPNACEALCVGFSREDLIDCNDTNDCDECPSVEDPVCVISDNGDIIQFTNKCFARCAGYVEVVNCEPDSCFCPTIFDPVCVVSGRDTIQFSNRCFAACEGFAEDQLFRCISDSTCVCPEIYAPVCILSANGTIITFDNECFAICEGFSPDQFVPCDINCACPDVVDPICAKQDDGSIIRFKNSCEAICAGYEEASLFDCDDEPCICPEYYDPVCVIDADGQVKQFSNECFAACEGFGPQDFVACDSSCVCDVVYDPVCIYLDDGQVIRFGNACEANCAGYGEGQLEKCEPGSNCICPQIFAPVCVQLDDGQIRSFSNACYALCEGYSETDFVSCGGGTCECPLIFDPVCAIDSGNVILTFPNKCFAECEGFSDYFSCDERELDCFANFSWTEAPTAAALPSIQFEDLSFSQQSRITAWQWEFGDGTMSNEQNPLHVYPIAGGYSVQLTITTADGCQASISRYLAIGNNISVDGPQCQAMFFFTQDSSQNGRFHFNDLSIGEVDSWLWDFGDGQTSTEPNPSHEYEIAGTYLVSLTIFSGLCESQTEMLLVMDSDIWYNRDCNALFLPLINPDSLEVFFLNLSSDDAVNYFWDFGDGQTSTEFVTSHRYESSGVYEVTLLIETAAGCTNLFTVVINFAQNDFTAAPQFLTTSTKEEKIQLESIQLFPNPTRDFANVSFEVAEKTSLEIHLLSIDGTLQKRMFREVDRGTHNERIDLTDLPAGIYIVNVNTERNTRSLKLVVNR